jgi:hypothetical protein
MDLRSDRPGAVKPLPKFAVFDTKSSTLTSYVGKDVASKVHIDISQGVHDDYLQSFWDDIQNFRVRAEPGADARQAKEEEVFRFRFGYAQDEFESWMKALNHG